MEHEILEHEEKPDLSIMHTEAYNNQGIKNTFNKIVNEYFQNLEKEMAIHIQEA